MTSVLLDTAADAEEAVERGAAVIASGGVLLYPTDTIYGLGCDALNRDAVQRIYEIKRRPETMPMIVLVHSAEEATRLCADVPPGVAELMRSCWPGPLTVLLPAKEGLYPWLSAGSGKIGVRHPDHAFCVRLLAAVGRPLVSTSANRSGAPYAGDVRTLRELFEPEVDLVVDAGPLPESPPSTIVDGSCVPVLLVREGAFPASALQRFLR